MPPLPKSDKERLTARTAIVSILILFALADAYFVGVLYRARVGSFPDGKDVFRHLQVLSAIDREFSQRPDDAGFWETMHIFINSRVPYPRRLTFLPSSPAGLFRLSEVTCRPSPTFSPYILAQFVGIYLMARRELPRARAMTVVAAVALLAPVTQAAGDFRVAYPTAAAVALSLGILTHVGTFVRAVPTVMFGLSVGFGLLTYYLYVLYVLPAAALVFVLRVRRADVRIPLLLIRAAQVMVPALVMAAPYYFQDRVIGLFAKEAAGVGARTNPAERTSWKRRPGG
ncbi:MAG: hypothetical protein M5R36_03380 [Deltaproteobacteria bacterium]|nr:hypothetical protein [Deltaproteobacteria bacterium]